MFSIKPPEPARFLLFGLILSLASPGCGDSKSAGKKNRPKKETVERTEADVTSGEETTTAGHWVSSLPPNRPGDKVR
ncbi:MAG: hypothetical protein AAF514_17520, partial [Verrucomicrobiota bacterium]